MLGHKDLQSRAVQLVLYCRADGLFQRENEPSACEAIPVLNRPDLQDPYLIYHLCGKKGGCANVVRS